MDLRPTCQNTNGIPLYCLRSCRILMILTVSGIPLIVEVRQRLREEVQQRLREEVQQRLREEISCCVQ